MPLLEIPDAMLAVYVVNAPKCILNYITAVNKAKTESALFPLGDMPYDLFGSAFDELDTLTTNALNASLQGFGGPSRCPACRTCSCVNAGALSFR